MKMNKESSFSNAFKTKFDHACIYITKINLITDIMYKEVDLVSLHFGLCL